MDKMAFLNSVHVDDWTVESDVIDIQLYSK